MRIGIDARLYTQTGVGRYLRNIIMQLQRLDKENEYIVYLRRQEFDSFKPLNKKWKKRLVNIPWHTVKEQILFPLILLQDNLDVAHFPYFNVPIFYPKKYLLTIHDLIVDHFDTGRASTLPAPLYKIKRFGYKLSLFCGIRRANGITAISQTTKEEIIDHYEVKEDKITVTYDALDTQFLQTVKSYKAKNYYNFPYILYVGNAYPHKNLERLLNALSIIQKVRKVKLVLAGDDSYFYPRLKNYAANLGLSREVVFFGNANDKKLVNLYNFASCLVFPSLMEGFGLPNLEALTCGVLPVVSDIPVFREIWGEKLVYFNPYNVADMVDKIQSVLQLSEPEYKKKAYEAEKNINNFSWKKTAEETLKIYKQIYNS